jgi:hypothetical protein
MYHQESFAFSSRRLKREDRSYRLSNRKLASSRNEVVVNSNLRDEVIETQTEQPMM